MKLNRLVPMVVVLQMHPVAADVAAQDAVQVCSLLAREEVAPCRKERQAASRQVAGQAASQASMFHPFSVWHTAPL